MEVEKPLWLNEYFVKEAIKKESTDDQIFIENINAKRAVPKGNNYICLVMRVDVAYRLSSSKELKTVSIIVKAPQRNGICRSFSESLVKENLMYDIFLPKLHNTLNEYLTPKHYFSTETDVLVLQDLSVYGYNISDRKLRLDFSHTAMLLKALAKFHAGSYKVLQENPQLIHKIGKEFYSNEIISQAKINNFHVAAKILASWPEANRYVEKLRDYGDKCWDLLLDNLTMKEGEFNTLNHGDVWVANVLFKHKDEVPIDIKLIDLQICRFCSPVIDLHNLFYSSVQEELLTDRYEDLLAIYLTELNTTLDYCGVQRRMEMEELVKGLNDHKFYALFTTIFVLPFVVNDTNLVIELDKVDMEDFQDNQDTPVDFVFQTQAIRKLLPKRLSEFEEKGWL